MTDPKTPAQLEAEIAYFAWEIARSASADRVRRAHRAIQVRQQQLAEARRVRPPTAITCPTCHLTSVHPSDIRERYCGFCHRFHDDPAQEAAR